MKRCKSKGKKRLVQVITTGGEQQGEGWKKGGREGWDEAAVVVVVVGCGGRVVGFRDSKALTG